MVVNFLSLLSKITRCCLEVLEIISFRVCKISIGLIHPLIFVNHTFHLFFILCLSGVSKLFFF
jgi:hypothetical protein